MDPVKPVSGKKTASASAAAQQSMEHIGATPAGKHGDAASGASTATGGLIARAMMHRDLVLPPATALAGVHHGNVQIAETVRLTPSTQLRLARDPFDAHSEAIRLLRTELLLRHPGRGDAMCIAVVSAVAGEGRSRLAAELALAFSQLDGHTLLVDADFRQPQQHALFGTDSSNGLAQALSSGNPLDFHQVEGFSNLLLVTAGEPPSNPIELLTRNRFSDLMEEWRSTFRFIVVDTPATVEYADGLAIAAIVGSVLTVTRAGHTPYARAREMLRRLSATHATVLGGVLNHF